ncbi:MAG: hypothetical protein AAF236_00370 [Verrucomicrobiota bacterium]
MCLLTLDSSTDIGGRPRTGRPYRTHKVRGFIPEGPPGHAASEGALYLWRQHGHRRTTEDGSSLPVDLEKLISESSAAENVSRFVLKARSVS